VPASLLDEAIDGLAGTVLNVLSNIVRCRAEIAIMDITGVPTVDTMVAQLKTVSAARLMGADCIISGIRSADRADYRASRIAA